jgi:hypothetical protein
MHLGAGEANRGIAVGMQPKKDPGPCAVDMQDEPASTSVAGMRKQTIREAGAPLFFLNDEPQLSLELSGTR